MCTNPMYFKSCASLIFLLCLCCGRDPSNGHENQPDMDHFNDEDLGKQPSIEMEEAIAALTDIQLRHACLQVWQCPESSYNDLPFLARHPTLERCQTDEHNLLEDFLSIRYARFARQVEAQNMRYDGVSAHSCVMAAIQSFDETLCTLSVLQDPSCDAIFSGDLTPGASCVEHEECQQGTTCEETFSLISCTGQCTACGVEACAKDTYCKRSMGRASCEAISPVGGMCEEDKACGDERQNGCLRLDGEDVGECIELGSRGKDDSCSEDEHCARGLTCRAQRCEEVVLKNLGELCSVLDVQAGLCQPGLVCAQENTGDPALCTLPRKLDEACTSLLQCEAGLQCEESTPGDPRTGRCKPLRADDERCELPFECDSKQCIVLAPMQGVCASEVTCE